MKEIAAISRAIAVTLAVAMSACAARIHFDIAPLEAIPAPRLRLAIDSITDARPPNERSGYDIFYITSISDADYDHGFVNELRAALVTALDEPFTLVDSETDADVHLDVVARHFYGEYARSVKTVFLEYAACILLCLPRLISDAIPYNHFAGRAALQLRFTWADGSELIRELDVRVVEEVSTYRRSAAATAAMLSDALQPQLSAAIIEVYDGTPQYADAR